MRRAIDLLGSGLFSYGDTRMFNDLVNNLLHDDPYLVLADFRSYLEAQEKVSETYRDQATWSRMSILNVARMGKFSSDRSIRDYCGKIWNVHPGDGRPDS